MLTIHERRRPNGSSGSLSRYYGLLAILCMAAVFAYTITLALSSRVQASPDIQYDVTSLPMSPETVAQSAFLPDAPSSCVYYTWVSTDVPKTICDFCTITSTVDVTFPSNGGVFGVALMNLRVDHMWIGALEIRLTNPSGTTVILVDNVCDTYANIPGNNLADWGAPIGSECPLQSGATYSPSFPFTPFFGAPNNGTWTLTIESAVGGVPGTLVSWSLQLMTSCPPTPTPPPPPTPTNTRTITATPTPTEPLINTSTTTASPTSTVTATSTSISSITNTPVGTDTPTSTWTPSPTWPPSPTATPTLQSDPTPCLILFTDVPEDHTFYPFVRCMACRGIITGYTTGCETGNPCFRPASNVTRGQLAKIVSNAAGFTEPAIGQQYEDVPEGSTFYDFIWRLSDRDIVNGYPCGGVGEPCGDPELPYFRPNANVTRGQLSKIVANGAGLSDPITDQQYEDVPEGSTFYEFIGRLTALDVISGYSCGGVGEPCGNPELPYFRPSASATRGQASKIVANTFFPSCVVPRKR